jgi:outer membrane protein assembly factor BamB
VGANGRLFFFSNQQRVYALSASGTQLWARALQDTNGIVGLVTPPVLAGSRLIVGTARGTLVALDTATGETLWESESLTSLQGSPTADPSADRIYAVSQADGVLHCLRLSNGRPVWKSSPTGRSDGSLSMNHSQIVYGNCSAALLVFSGADGRPLAPIPLGADGQAAGGVALAGAQAFLGIRSGAVLCADLEKEALVWTNAVATGEAFATPAVNDRLVVFGAGDGAVHAADRASGRPFWKTPLGGPPASPVLAGDTVVVTASGILFLLAAQDGHEVLRFALSDQLTAPAVIDSLVIVGGDNGLVSAFASKPAPEIK